MAADKTDNANLVYQIDDQPRSLRDWVIYSLQWTVTMCYAVVWGYAIVGLAMGFKGDELARYMASIVLTIGLSTLIQVWLGHRMAMVSGPNIIPSLAIVAAISSGGEAYAQNAFLAQSIASIILIVLAFTGVVRLIKKIWSPLILGSMILMVGLSISRQGISLLTAGGFDTGFYTGLALALLATVVAIRSKGIWGTLPPLLIIGLGYIIFMVTGSFNWELTGSADWFILPRLLPYGLKMPPWDLIAIMVLVNVMSALNLFSNLSGYADVIHHKLKDKDINRSFFFSGLLKQA